MTAPQEDGNNNWLQLAIFYLSEFVALAWVSYLQLSSTSCGLLPHGILIFINDEFAAGLFQITHFLLMKDQIRTLFYKNGFVYNIINEFRPFLQDLALFKYWRDHVIYEGGPITARMLGYIDENSENPKGYAAETCSHAAWCQSDDPGWPPTEPLNDVEHCHAID